MGYMNANLESYSQSGQDLFVYNLANKENGTFLDLGCHLPKNINNTYLLERFGWTGLSLDIKDYSQEWKSRKNKFLQCDCFKQDYNELLSEYYQNQVIDYLTIDMERLGDRFKLLKMILETNYEFKIITIEHDSHLGDSYVKEEKIPQREYLKEKGYVLVCGDVSHKDFPNLFYEDWWVNAKYISEDVYTPWLSNQISCDKIFERMGIKYTINEVSTKWY